MNCGFINIGQLSSFLPIKYALSYLSEILLGHGFEKGAQELSLLFGQDSSRETTAGLARQLTWAP